MNIVVLEPLGVPGDIIKAKLAEKISVPYELTIYETRPGDDEEIRARGVDADIIVEANLPLSGEVIRGCHRLKMIAVAFAGIDHIDTAACEEREITIANCPGYSAAAVAELVFTLIGNLYRRVVAFDGITRAGGHRNGFLGTEIGGKTMGIIGFGCIGKKVAALATAYGCTVLAYARHPQSCLGVEFVDLDTLLRTADIVTLHVPLTEATKALINGDKLALMKGDALLINTARGGVVDNAALGEALAAGSIGGAGIDVFDSEPPLPPDDPLCGEKRALLTPHIGFATKEAFMNRLEMSAANIADFLNKA